MYRSMTGMYHPALMNQVVNHRPKRVFTELVSQGAENRIYSVAYDPVAEQDRQDSERAQQILAHDQGRVSMRDVRLCISYSIREKALDWRRVELPIGSAGIDSSSLIAGACGFFQ